MAIGRWLCRAAIALAVAAAAGCGGPPVGSVAGTVTVDAKPVDGGFISFAHPSGKVVTARIEAGGTYRADDVPVGEVAVSVTPPPGAEDPQVKKGATGRPPTRPAPPWPERYTDPVTSGLKFTVQAGANTYNPPLKKS